MSTASPRAAVAFAGLVATDVMVRCVNLKRIGAALGRIVVTRCDDAPAVTDAVCGAIDRACAWYPKKVWCLQRSVLLAYLLRRHGVPAALVIGVRRMPFLAHAWVEVDGAVVRDAWADYFNPEHFVQFTYR